MTATKTSNVVFGAIKLSLLKDFHFACNLVTNLVTKQNKPPLNIWDSKTNTVAIDEVDALAICRTVFFLFFFL